MSGVLPDYVVSMAAKSRRLKILTMLNNLRCHLLRQNGVVIIQDGKCFLMLVFGYAHNQVR